MKSIFGEDIKETIIIMWKESKFLSLVIAVSFIEAIIDLICLSFGVN